MREFGLGASVVSWWVLGVLAVAATVGRVRLRWVLAPALWCAVGSLVAALVVLDVVLVVTLVADATTARRRRRRRERLPEFADETARRLDRGSTLEAVLRDLRDQGGIPFDDPDRIVASLERGSPVPWHDVDGRRAEAAVILAALRLAEDDRDNGVEVLRSAAAVARARRLRRLDVDAQAAGARASTVVIASVPWCVAAVAWATGDLVPAEHTVNVAVGLLLSAVGVWWSVRLVARVEVDT